jgi:hypothetical protein
VRRRGPAVAGRSARSRGSARMELQCQSRHKCSRCFDQSLRKNCASLPQRPAKPPWPQAFTTGSIGDKRDSCRKRAALTAKLRACRRPAHPVNVKRKGGYDFFLFLLFTLCVTAAGVIPVCLLVPESWSASWVDTNLRELVALSTSQAVNVLQVPEMLLPKIPRHIAHMCPLAYDQNQLPPDTRYRDRKEQGWGNFCWVQ